MNRKTVAGWACIVLAFSAAPVCVAFGLYAGLVCLAAACLCHVASA